MQPSSTRLVLLLALLGLAGVACGSGASSVPATTAETAAAASTTAEVTTTAPAVDGDITVFAAASLSAAFNEVGAAFSSAYPGAEATFSFDASSALVAQITQGAPADLFASADTTNMDKLRAAGLNGSEPVIFATNHMAIIVPKGNPEGITGVADLARPGLKVVLCAAEVPCGRYALQILDAAQVTVTPVSLEQSVKGVVTKVTAGEADAGIVYVTDVKAAGDDAEGVDIPTDIKVAATYSIASVKSSKNLDTDLAFIGFLTSPEGQAILATHGFGRP